VAVLCLLVCNFGVLAPNLGAQEPAPSPTLEQRVADLEAYVNNIAPGGTVQVADASGQSVEVQRLSNVAGPGPGHNAWIMTSALLVLFMTLPGLALFYGGLVRTKNVLSILAQCIGIAGMVTIMWWAVGYSLVFGRSFEGSFIGPFLGGSEYFFLNGVGSAPNGDYAAWVSHSVWAMYQLMFAIITPALIIGAIAERMKYSAVMLFICLWMFFVYFPLAHMTWGATGYMNGVWNASAGIRSIDFAGGTVVHMSSGWSALLLCLLLGKRMGFGRQVLAPHSLVLCMVGTGMLWVGWYGFNAGSAAAADGVAANAFTTTTLCAAVGGFSWGVVEWMFKGHPSVLGMCSGIVAGLVVITPACGFVTPGAAVGMGVVAGVVPFLACSKLKTWLGYDDALDTFGVHGVGGTIGALLTGIFATSAANPNLSGNLGDILGSMLWLEQLKSMALTVVLSLVATGLIVLIVRSLVGLRVPQDVEFQGLDINEHGEQGYMYSESSSR
jgi:Amt family ammonium transporter